MVCFYYINYGTQSIIMVQTKQQNHISFWESGIDATKLMEQK